MLRIQLRFFGGKGYRGGVCVYRESRGKGNGGVLKESNQKRKRGLAGVLWRGIFFFFVPPHLFPLFFFFAAAAAAALGETRNLLSGPHSVRARVFQSLHQ